MQRARRRKMAAVPEADVVVADPTRSAAAPNDEVGSPGRPKVSAEGADSMALGMRAAAEQHAVPVAEKPRLARALCDAVDPNEEIPEEHYRAVAEIVGYVLRLKGKLPGEAAPRAGRGGQQS